MKRFLITGVSSGIGRALTKKLVNKGNIVWGVARREHLLNELKKELKDTPRFRFTTLDISKTGAWQQLIKQMTVVKFVPEVIIFNAAISINDLTTGLDTKLSREIFATNFFSTIEGIENLFKMVKPGTQFIAISSSSALKGSGIEGVGYPASKAALSIAFESLHQKYRQRYFFKVIYLGPVAFGMGPFRKKFPLVLSEKQAVDKIIRVVEGKQTIHYYPLVLFLILRIIRLLPSGVYFFLLSKIENLHIKLEKSL